MTVVVTRQKKITRGCQRTKEKVALHYIFTQTCPTKILHVLTTLAEGVGGKQEQHKS